MLASTGLVVLLVLGVLGAIWLGVCTPTEGAGVGAFGALVFALARRSLNWTSLYAALVESARTTSMLFMILIGALMFAEFVNITTMPNDLIALVKRYEISPVMVVAMIMLIYVLLGTAMEELSMILLTVPLFFPVVKELGYDPIKDLSPITMLGESPSAVLVAPTLPVNTLNEFIDYVKANPGKVSFGSNGIGSSPHLAMELLNSAAGINITHVPFRGGAHAVPGAQESCRRPQGPRFWSVH